MVPDGDLSGVAVFQSGALMGRLLAPMSRRGFHDAADSKVGYGNGLCLMQVVYIVFAHRYNEPEDMGIACGVNNIRVEK